MSRRADTKPLTFEKLVSPEVGANYRRLRRDKRTANVKAKFLKRGMTELQFGYLLQMISALPLHWKSQNEAWKKRLPKLIRIAQTLRGLATEISADPDLARFLIDLEVTEPSYDGPSRHREIGTFLERAAAQIESANNHLVNRRKANTVSPIKHDRRKRVRTIGLTSYTLLGIFNTLHSLLPGPAVRISSPRPLNKECEILAEIVLKKTIRRGDVSRLRQPQRRKFYK